MQISKIAVITGAGSGIGRAAAVTLSKRGYGLALLGRRMEALEETKALCASPDNAHSLAVDITDEQAVDQTFVEIASKFGRIDILFNNAGNFPARAPLDEIAFADWTKIIDVNLNGAFLCARAAFRQMKRQSPAGGRIINNGSISARVPRPEAAAYTTSKHAITGLTKAILLDGRPHNIVCAQIDIGNAATELSQGLQAGALQPDGSIRPEPMMQASNVSEAIGLIADLPLEANIPFMTIMASKMPFIGRG